ncbi:MAG: alpha/beta fold hydrolase [Gemmatimonadaceae bacterium]
MQWRKAAVVGGAAIGAAAFYTVTREHRREPLDDALGGEAGEILWRGHRIAFTRHGQGSPVLLVHGFYPGASSFEWRHTVPALVDRHTVITVDLLGFGRSDRPAVRYTPGLYQALIGDVIARLAQGPSAVVASGLAAAHLIALAARDPRQIAVLALIAPTGIAHLRDAEPVGGTTSLLLDAPIIGNSVYNGLTSPSRMRDYLESAYADDRRVTPALVESYVRAARQPGGKRAVAALLRGQLNVDVRAALRRVRQPTLLLWGDLARNNSVEHAHAFRVLKRDLEWTLIQEAGDLPHEERADEVNAALHAFLERARRSDVSGRPQLVMA